MSQHLAHTSPGGEQTQYEGAHTSVDPPAKLAGHFDATTETTHSNAQNRATNAPNTQGVTSAEKIRFGQAISEEGVGGKTGASMGDASTEGGFGGTKALDEESEGFAKVRREQGYGGGRDADRHIGA
ncbi:hypothetical protein K505DRAFT_358969 [Melanomma pulvis-pyrius CBS 109.77]|uniref:Uncharacterized protein n=1 Tax=Melanomma pulvis-pyrius CBS 109.77 TaxID=1314802 RepID=A0A6A6XLQ5_9PLEO|nr:hypothetical protein K505DRAFT_358969 [Melanomma pulvis-pyrius CBS 109.77]